jgi:hypothetical protein
MKIGIIHMKQLPEQPAAAEVRAVGAGMFRDR